MLQGSLGGDVVRVPNPLPLAKFIRGTCLVEMWVRGWRTHPARYLRPGAREGEGDNVDLNLSILLLISFKSLEVIFHWEYWCVGGELTQLATCALAL